MKPAKPNAPEVSDASAKQHTGRTLKEWFKTLDGLGGAETGRRDLIQKLQEKHPLDAWWLVTLVVEYEIARGQKEKDGHPKGYGICATKTFAAPVEKVYAVWADGRTWPKWFGEKSKADVKEGGAFSNADGDAGTFKKVRENKDIKLTWDNPRHAHSGPVEVVFQSKPSGKSLVIINHNRIQTRAQADELRESWLAALEAIKPLVGEG